MANNGNELDTVNNSDELNKFDFHQHMDSMGYDMLFVGVKPLKELIKICKCYKKCIGFNTIGYLKFNITDKTNFKKLDVYKNEYDGLYIYKKRHNKLITNMKHKKYIGFEDYTFYPNQDSSDNDMGYLSGKSLEELKQISDSYPDCAGFNTIGFFKNKIKHESEFIDLNIGSVNEGLYVKKTRFRVKLLCNWCSSKDLCDDWNRMSKGNYKWNDIEITWKDNVDFYVIINKPLSHEFYKKDRTIVFHMEPWCGNPQQSWGVKTWGEWAEPDESKFLQIRSHKNFYNNGFWQLKATYNDLKTMSFEKTKLLSSICSSKYFDPGHIKRINFLKFIESKNDDIVTIDIYNSDNVHNFKGYMGPHPHNNKDIGIMPYKYYFMPENNEEYNFMTEKIWEPLLTETVAFYWGCPNLSDYIDPRAYILLDLDNFEKSFDIIKNAIVNDEWSKRIEIIRMEKQKVLEYFAFFPTLERILHKDFKFNYNPTDNDIKFHKYFNNLINKTVKNIIFIDICNANNNCEDMLNNITNTINNVDHIYIFNYGLPNDTLNYNKSKITVINYSKDISLFKISTLNLIKIFSTYFTNCNILYFDINSENKYLINYLNYFLINNYKTCTNLLCKYDLIYCSYNNKMINDGWWINSNYINKLSKDQKINECIQNPELCNKYMIYDLMDTESDEINENDTILYNNDNTPTLFNKFYEFNKEMRIKCVNLERRLDRKKVMENLLSKTDLIDNCDFVKAVDGLKLLLTDELEIMFSDNDFGTKRGAIGCALSHLELWKQLINDDLYNKYLVLEDDIEIDENIKFKLNQMNDILNYDNNENNNWDIIYLGFHIYNKNKNKYNEKINTIKQLSIIPYDTEITIGGTFGYIINLSGANKLVNYIKNNGIKHGIDYLMFHCAEEMDLKHYELVPQLVFSDFVGESIKVDSDIQYDKSRLF